MHKREFLIAMGGLAGAATLTPAHAAGASASAGPTGAANVRDFGAVGDGTQLDTKALQAAIDGCARAGGGTVRFPPGTYLSGTLFLKSNLVLHLEAGATLLGSRNLADYPPTIPAIRSFTDNYTERSLLYGENLERIALEGRGTIDGQGAAFKGPYKVRPYLIRMIGCRDVAVQDLTLKDSPMWVQHYLACDGVRIDGLTVRSRCNANNDGIDIDGCERVTIANCNIGSGDDAIVLKSTLDRACRNVAITNCLLSSDCNALKLGTESNGGFENIAISNCTIYDTRLSGLALELVDGGTLERVTVSNLTMRNARCPIFIRLGNRARPFQEGTAAPGLGRLRSVHISGIVAEGADQTGCSITGLPEHPAEDITLDNIRLRFTGGGTDGDARRAVPEQAAKYPEHSMFGVLPGYGFYCRHVRGLRLSRVSVEFAEPDRRPSLVCDEVEDLDLFDWRGTVLTGGPPVVRFTNVRTASVHGVRSPAASAFLRVEGSKSDRIRLFANDLADAAKSVELAEGVALNGVSERP
jgi:polygalacturonase